MGKLKNIPYEDNECYYSVTIDHFKNMSLGILGVLIYNIINEPEILDNPGFYGVVAMILLSGAVHFILKHYKNFGYGKVSAFRYKKFAAKFISIILLCFSGVFCSFAYDILTLTSNPAGKTVSELVLYIVKALFWIALYIGLSFLFAHFSINKLAEAPNEHGS